MGRNDTNYVCLRVTPEERQMYDDKCGKVVCCGKTMLRQYLSGKNLREKAPPEASDVHHQLFKIHANIMNLYYTNRPMSPEERHLNLHRKKYLEKYISDFVDVVYLGHLWKNL